LPSNSRINCISVVKRGNRITRAKNTNAKTKVVVFLPKKKNLFFLLEELTFFLLPLFFMAKKELSYL
jgi:hypothetical protein